MNHGHLRTALLSSTIALSIALGGSIVADAQTSSSSSAGISSLGSSARTPLDQEVRAKTKLQDALDRLSDGTQKSIIVGKTQSSHRLNRTTGDNSVVVEIPVLPENASAAEFESFEKELEEFGNLVSERRDYTEALFRAAVEKNEGLVFNEKWKTEALAVDDLIRDYGEKVEARYNSEQE
ncbi:hypothetical protein [Corynebacterium lubricantis]|uniref:hypothetical protein n=1 Tax=Corynebacterium lubricantis TaxID=541095 RepID=UPI00035E67A7|nr:hypothetical protein [Corynebacterium lubricantis]